jgi:hypothetical protein
MRKDPAPSRVLTSWGAPTWARTSEADEQAIDHCRSVGEFQSAETGNVVAVEIVQRDELLIEAGAATVQRRPVQLRVGESRLNVEEAHALVQMVTAAFGMIEESSTDR